MRLAAGFSGLLARNAAVAYALALAVSALAIAVNIIGGGLLGDRPFTSLYTAVVISAYFGGLGPGLLATVICAAFVSFFMLQPIDSLAIGAGSDVAALILFAIASIFICWVLHSLRQTAETLRKERDLSDELSQRLEQTVRQKDLLVREVQHRVANSLQLVSSFLMLQRRAMTSPDGRHDLEEASRRIHALAHIQRRLCNTGEAEHVELVRYLQELCRDLIKATAPPAITCAVDGPAGIWLPQDKIVPLALIVNELVTNALEHGLYGRNDGRITIRLERREPDRAALIVTDDGVGLPADFNAETIQSVGLSIVRALTSQIKGSFRLMNNNGTTWELEFPV